MGVGVERRGRELNAVGDEALFDVEPRCDFFVGGGERLEELRAERKRARGVLSRRCSSEDRERRRWE